MGRNREEDRRGMGRSRGQEQGGVQGRKREEEYRGESNLWGKER